MFARQIRPGMEFSRQRTTRKDPEISSRRRWHTQLTKEPDNGSRWLCSSTQLTGRGPLDLTNARRRLLDLGHMVQKARARRVARDVGQRGRDLVETTTVLARGFVLNSARDPTATLRVQATPIISCSGSGIESSCPRRLEVHESIFRSLI